MVDILRIAISLIPGLETEERALLEECVSTLEEFNSLSRGDVESLVGRRLRIRSTYPSHGEMTKKARRIEEDLQRSDAFLVPYGDEGYPPQLRESSSPPYLLYVRGEFPSFDLPMIAIVGTRRPSHEAVDAAFTLAAEFSLMGIPVVSGLAYGIDASAHWAAVKTGNYTLAVLGTPIDRVYPDSNRELARRILANNGALISEKPPCSPIGKYDFPRRNRIIAGLSRGVVVVQAPAKSGALITAEWAVHSNRAVYVHSAGTAGALGSGTKRLVAEGVMEIDEASMVLNDWGVNLRGAHLERVPTEQINTARIMEEELKERLVKFDRYYYRRVG